MNAPEATELRLQGFCVRPPAPHEVATLLEFFGSTSLGHKNVLLLGAFGQPGDVLLGAAIVRTSDRQRFNIGHFLLLVRPDCRRRRIGTTLMSHLFQLALSNGAERLILAELIHQDRDENAFLRAMGFSPERSFATYTLDIDQGLATVCAPVVRRFRLSHPHLAGAQFVTLDQLDQARVAHFFSANYSGFVDRRLELLESGYYDLSLSVAAVRDGEIFAGALFRSRPDEPSIMLDLILTAPQYRQGPTPLVLCAQVATIAMGKGYTRCVFEADEHHDHFAVGFARRCGAMPQWYRHRYAIGRGDMAARAC